jgi:hypothetical protein
MNRDSSRASFAHSLHVLPCFADTRGPWIRKLSDADCDSLVAHLLVGE